MRAQRAVEIQMTAMMFRERRPVRHGYASMKSANDSNASLESAKPRGQESLLACIVCSAVLCAAIRRRRFRRRHRCYGCVHTTFTRGRARWHRGPGAHCLHHPRRSAADRAACRKSTGAAQHAGPGLPGDPFREAGHAGVFRLELNLQGGEYGKCHVQQTAVASSENEALLNPATWSRAGGWRLSSTGTASRSGCATPTWG